MACGVVSNAPLVLLVRGGAWIKGCRGAMLLFLLLLVLMLLVATGIAAPVGTGADD